MSDGLVALAAAPTAVTAAELVAGLGLRERGAIAGPPPRPRVVAAMIGSLDGRGAVAGRSVGLGHPQDRAVLRALRAFADAVLVGAATVRAERYANLFDTDEQGMVAVATRSGDVPWEVGLFSEPGAHVAIYGTAPVEVPATVSAQVSVHATATLGDVLAHLRAERGAELVVCEGGPRLLHALVAAGLLDDLVLTVAPLFVAGDEPAGLSGPPLDPPVGLTLTGAWRAGDHAFLHYTA
jgi:riboflavin biosynthesis pyrimidine reductase